MCKILVIALLALPICVYAQNPCSDTQLADNGICAALPQYTPLSDDELQQHIDQLLIKSDAQTVFETKEYDQLSTADNATDYDYDKRQSFYYDWHYDIYEDEFSDNSWLRAMLPSNDGQAILMVSYNKKDKSLKNPNVGLSLSGSIDSYGWHSPWCIQSCHINLNIDGVKYQNIIMQPIGNNSILSKYSKTTLNRIKDGKTIKIQVPSITGDAIVYIFEPNMPLDLSQFK